MTTENREHRGYRLSAVDNERMWHVGIYPTVQNLPKMPFMSNLVQGPDKEAAFNTAIAIVDNFLEERPPAKAGEHRGYKLSGVHNARMWHVGIYPTVPNLRKMPFTSNIVHDPDKDAAFNRAVAVVDDFLAARPRAKAEMQMATAC